MRYSSPEEARENHLKRLREKMPKLLPATKLLPKTENILMRMDPDYYPLSFIELFVNKLLQLDKNYAFPDNNFSNELYGDTFERHIDEIIWPECQIKGIFKHEKIRMKKLWYEFARGLAHECHLNRTDLLIFSELYDEDSDDSLSDSDDDSDANRNVCTEPDLYGRKKIKVLDLLDGGQDYSLATVMNFMELLPLKRHPDYAKEDRVYTFWGPSVQSFLNIMYDTQSY